MPDRSPERLRRIAAALRYRPGEDAAPRVVAAGAGHLADAIVARAQKAGVPVRQAPDLAAALAALGVGQQIPPELYRPVAEILAWVARVDTRRAQQLGINPGAAKRT